MAKDHFTTAPAPVVWLAGMVSTASPTLHSFGPVAGTGCSLAGAPLSGRQRATNSDSSPIEPERLVERVGCL
jgi:hypothetical protein